MDPTSSGRFRVHDRRVRPDIGDDAREPEPDPGDQDTAPTEFVLVELPDSPVDPERPERDDVYDPLYVRATGYDDLSSRIESLEPGTVIEATLVWNDGTARFAEITVVRESRLYFLDDVDGMFEAAVERWNRTRSRGESMGSAVTRSNDGDPNGALYVFAESAVGDTFDAIRSGRTPIEPLVALVNERRTDDHPRSVFVLRPRSREYVVVYIVFETDGILSRTVRDTYDIGTGLGMDFDPSS